MNPASQDELLGVADEWVLLASRGDFEDAQQLLIVPPEPYWTPEFIQKVVNGYGDPERSLGYKITSPDMATDPDCTMRRECEMYSNEELGEVGEIVYSLPLNGQWSDLTASFSVIGVPGGMALALDDIHVK